MENNTLTKVWLVASGESDENLCLDDVSVYLTEAEARGFKWAYWEYQAYFGVWDPKAKEWRKELLEVLMKR